MEPFPPRDRRALFELWSRLCERYEGGASAPQHFVEWSGATKDLLLGLGMEWNATAESYVFPDEEPFTGGLK